MKNLNTIRQIAVKEDEAGDRLDRFLSRHFPGTPRSHIYKIIRSGEVRVNMKRAEAAWRLRVGDLVRVPPLLPPPDEEKKSVPPRRFPTIFEDDSLLAIDKPAGVAVHGGSGVSFGVIEQLRSACQEAHFLELVHRLDKETSGVLLLAKKRSTLKALHELFRRGQVEKRYFALVLGRWRAPLRHIRLALEKMPAKEGGQRVRVAAEGKPAESTVRLLKRWDRTPWGAMSLVEVDLKTGRTHQIRVHLAHLGFPLAGDPKYGHFELNRRLQKGGLARMFLHAARLAFRHPVSGERLEFVAELPSDLAEFLASLGDGDAV
ncbi:MAG: RluA family pseudouridine synthase [Rhodocyclaceae bacterium]|nr:RluA family pseudouridine synthase [Rhodocyclaceae bacterium]